ncbi:MAG: bifunctional [glutamate--ammonia ligase]-adenylyl-L-tyrosine phosphorylase/[glutamate--ammonia-ligase] adenylyltransferase [Nitrospinae bacterium]|nr:bifunctional [glutamate--ammonia ligase]-adenylyl-L-tyrosine phosphorylase/[glutamate--ammonia-ligase] adenylyltransferase [Nitrospinota bacterium]
MPNPKELIESIYDRRPWDESLEEPLRAVKLEDPKKAWKNLLVLSAHCNFPSLFPNFFSSLLEALARSHDPDIALHNFERFADTILDKDYFYTIFSGSADLLEALVVLFSGSQVLTDTLLSDPSFFDWLKEPGTLHKSKSRDEFMRNFYELAGAGYLSDETPALLRKFKKREYIRIGLRDLLGKTDFQETGKDVSLLADVCLQVAYEHADRVCRKKYGAPFYEDANGNWKEAEFTIIGMGKLGGQELNYSSDIDLIYIYTSSKGETRSVEGGSASIIRISTHEYFSKVALMVTRTINEITAQGNVFRVDLDLRPEGKSGEIVNSLTSCEIYYQSWGRTWERQALIKARVSAGSEALGEEFFTLLEPFIYRRSLDFAAIDEIRTMKEKINQSLKRKKSGRGNIKLGYGGIREVEFTVQAYQLLFGGKNKNLRGANTLLVLNKLKELGFLIEEDHDRLREAYTFLRNLENRVQISFGLQTHLLPEDEAQLSVLAHKMGLEGGSRKERAEKLLSEFDRHTRFVGELFSSLFAEKKKQRAAEIAEKEEEGRKKSGLGDLNIAVLEGIPFTDPQRTLRFLKSLRDGTQFSHPSEKSIEQFYAVLPKVLELCAEVPMPNSAVENLVKFVEASHAREAFLSLFQSNEKFLELLLIIFGSSDFLSGILIRQPGVTDVLRDLESIYRYKPPEKIVEELNRSLGQVPDFEAKKIFLRRFKQGEELRVGVRYLIREANLAGTLADLSTLAEVYLQAAYLTALKELRVRYGKGDSVPEEFAIIGMGKLGGHELNFGSDLDIVFVHGESTTKTFPQEELVPYYAKLSQLIYELTSQMTSAGYAYKVDADLRPEGAGGVLVMSVKGYEDYFKNRARVWERQAMTRGRFVAGNRQVGEEFLKVAQEFTYQSKLEYGSLIEISRLRERMEKELAQEASKGKNVKLGFGGLADIEFAVQILQMMHGKKHSRLRETNTLTIISRFDSLGLLDHEVSEELNGNYLFLRNLECALRILNPSSTNHLPRDEESLAVLARILGYEGGNTGEYAAKLMADYDRNTKEVRAFYRKTIDTLLRISL